jgi:hypothetical protein
MPWEIRIVNGTADAPIPLGTREEVIAAFAEALPGLTLAPPPPPPPEFLEAMPAALREIILRPKLEASFEAADLSIQFYADDAPLLHWVGGEVRGNGDPRPALASICAKRGWSALDISTASKLDLSPRGDAPGWKRFQEWRDRAIREIGTGGTTETPE